MKQVLRFLALAALICVPWVTQAQSNLLNEGFESMTDASYLTDNGYFTYSQSSCQFEVSTTEHNTGSTKSLYANSWDGSSGCIQILGLPTLSSPINNLEISFAYKSSSGTITLGYLTDDDYSTFTVLNTYSSSSSWTTTDYYNLSAVPTTATRIAIRFNSYWRFYVDDIIVRTLPTCVKPTGLTASLTPGNGTVAALTWTKGGSETAWVLEYSTASNFAGADQMTTGFTDNGDGTVTANLTSLTAEAIYYARVKADCGGDDESAWSNVCSFWPTATVPIVVNNGTTTNSNIPFYGYYVNKTPNGSQFIIPAATLGDINPGSTIKRMTFHGSTTSVNLGTSTFNVYLKEVDYTTFASTNDMADWATLDNVYHGSLTYSNNQMEIIFDNDFEYNGGNLLVGINIDETAASTGSSISFYGVNGTSGNSAYKYMGYSSMSSSLSAFLPKITFRLIQGVVACQKPAAPTFVSATTTTATLSWTAGAEETAWQVAYSTSADFDPDGVTPVDMTSNPGTITGLTPATTYYAYVRANCDANGYSDWSTLKCQFSTECEAVTAFPWSENFESYAAGNFSDPCWVNEHISGTGTQIFKVYTSTNGTNNTHQLQLPDQTSGTMTMLVLPGMTLPNSNYQFVIDVFRTNSTYSPSNNPYEGIRIYASTNGEIEGATELAFIPRQYDETNGAIPAEAAEGWYTYEIPLGISGTCYIILRGENRYCSSTYMDNFVVNEMPSCLKPTLVTCTATTPTSATLSWTAGDPGDDAWQISYKTGTDEWSTPADITTNPYTLTGLTENTTYDVRVRTNCGDGEENKSEWTAVTFTTPCAAITVDNTHPYIVDMMSDDIADCWTETDGTYHWDFDDSYGANFSSSGSSLQTSTKLVSPLFDFGAGDNWMSFTGYLEGYEGWNDDYTATLKVYYRTSPSGAWQELAGQSYSVTGDNDLDLDVSEVLLPENTCQLAFEATSDYNNYANAYLYDFIVEKVPSCRKPAALALVSKTAHSASLSFNETGTADAWVLEYSVNSDFSSASELTTGFTESAGTVTVDLSTLAQSTTYYVRVKSNCGGGDYSAWCNSINFTTLAGNAVPTGLAVNPATITSSSATASWTAVAGNTLHESYDIYWATADVMEVPASPVAPNLISGITATSQVISGLDPETNYKVWVRDNCGADDYSAWSSPVAFTTAADCQTPDGLAATNVGAHSATITWNDYGLTAFNLWYKEVGAAEWEQKNATEQPCDLDGLAANKTYNVKVQPASCTSAPEWSDELTFSTPCEAIDITAATPYIEDFEAPVTTAGYNTSNAADLVVPACWDNYTSNTSSAYAIPHIIKSGATYNYSSPASQVLYFYGSGNGYAALPEFSNDWDELQISFKYATEGSSQGTLTLGYITTADNGQYNSFTEIMHIDASSASDDHMLQAPTVYLGGLPANATRLVFRWYYNSWYGANIDDIVVSLITKDITANSWYAISSPTHNSGNNETVAGVTNLTSGTYDLLRYDEANATWENQKTHNDFILERGKGYIYRTNATKTLTFNGTANSGDIDVTLTATDAAGTMKGWNLLGNPYAHTYALTRDCYSLSTNGTWTVQAGSYTMAVAEAVLVKSNGETFHFTETPATKSAPASTIAFTVSNDEFTDIAYARFSSEEGLPKIGHLNPEAPMLSIDGYAIANLNEGIESFPMSFSGNGEYTLTVSGNTDITGYLHLVDRLTGRDIDLLSTPSYSFTGSPVSDRFTVKLTPDANEGNSTSRFAIFDGNSLIVNGEGTLEVYDVMGRRLMSAEVTGSEYRIPGSDLHTGVYVLRMNGNSQKIVIK